MKKIIISQRFEKIGEFKELRDNLDTRLTNLILKLGFLPILLPSNSRNVLRFGGPDKFLTGCGNQTEARNFIGLNPKKICNKVLKYFQN